VLQAQLSVMRASKAMQFALSSLVDLRLLSSTVRGRSGCAALASSRAFADYAFAVVFFSSFIVRVMQVAVGRDTAPWTAIVLWDCEHEDPVLLVRREWCERVLTTTTKASSTVSCKHERLPRRELQWP
jgi:hypothetical protein